MVKSHDASLLAKFTPRLNYNGGSFCCCISSKKSEKLHRVHLDSKCNVSKSKIVWGTSFRGSFTKTRLNPARTE